MVKKKKNACNAGDPGLIPGSGIFSGMVIHPVFLSIELHGQTMGVTKGQTPLSVLSTVTLDLINTPNNSRTLGPNFNDVFINFSF